ncbi:MAG: hypothetical protein ACI8T1_001708 [Verrucomicrobiales bacterium]|jgi:hypothetical protein
MEPLYSQPTPPVLELERVFKAPPKRVFDVFASYDGMEQWFGPGQCHVINGELDLRVGGRYRYVSLPKDVVRLKSLANTKPSTTLTESPSRGDGKAILSSTPPIRSSRLISTHTQKGRCFSYARSASRTTRAGPIMATAGMAHSTNWKESFPNTTTSTHNIKTS